MGRTLLKMAPVGFNFYFRTLHLQKGKDIFQPAVSEQTTVFIIDPSASSGDARNNGRFLGRAGI